MPAGDAVAVAERLLALQAQDARGVRLAIRARTTGLCATDVDRALSVERTLVIGWLNRGTLHLVRSEDYGWLHALTAPRMVAGNQRRLRQEGVSVAAAERGVEVIENSLGEEGPLRRVQLGDRIARAGVRTEGQALVHLLVLASLRGLIVRGPVIDGQHAFALARDWLGHQQPVERERAVAELARRYLRGHGPADERDLAKWSGLPLRDARAGLTAIARQLRQRSDGLVELASAEAPAELPPPRLLGAFDPLLHGWRSREPVLGQNVNVVTVNGIFRPIALVRGRAVTTWTMPNRRFLLAPFAPLNATDQATLEHDACDVARYLGQ
ncbi:MAG: winged helix DNA-binding domain-containing protein [Solirubrobacteraceae bacterium]